MTTSAGTVHQLMGSDDQHDLIVFPVVVAYNQIHHYAPTQYLCSTSLTDWRLAQMFRHLTCASQYYEECQDSINDPAMSYMVVKLNKQLDGIKHSIAERAKRGNYTASNPPVAMHEAGPKRADPLARYNKPDRNPFPPQKLPEPQFELLPNCQVDDATVPDIFDEEPDPPINIPDEDRPLAPRSASQVAPSTSTFSRFTAGSNI